MVKNSLIINLLSVLLFLTIVPLSKCDHSKKDKKDDDDVFNHHVKVSIIIPAYNSADYIERSVGHALNQTLKDIEVIVVDDKSTDNTLEVLKQFESDKRLKVVSLSENQGPSIARNTGMELAVGKFIGFIDSDDYVDDEFYESLYKLSKNQDLVIGAFVNSTNDSEKFVHHRKLYGYGCVGDSIWRKSFLEKHHIKFIEDKIIGEDVKFRRTVINSKPRKIEAPDEGIYYYYKKREGSLSNYDSEYIDNLTNIYNNSKK